MGGILIQSNPKAFSFLLDEFSSENINSGSEFRNKMLIPFLYPLKTPIYLFMQLLLFLWQYFLSSISSWHAKGSLVFDLLHLYLYTLPPHLLLWILSPSPKTNLLLIHGISFLLLLYHQKFSSLLNISH